MKNRKKKKKCDSVLQIDGWTDGWTNGRRDKQPRDKQTEGQTDGGTNRRRDKQTEGQTDGGTNRRRSKSLSVYPLSPGIDDIANRCTMCLYCTKIVSANERRPLFVWINPIELLIRKQNQKNSVSANGSHCQRLMENFIIIEDYFLG